MPFGRGYAGAWDDDGDDDRPAREHPQDKGDRQYHDSVDREVMAAGRSRREGMGSFADLLAVNIAPEQWVKAALAAGKTGWRTTQGTLCVSVQTIEQQAGFMFKTEDVLSPEGEAAIIKAAAEQTPSVVVTFFGHGSQRTMEIGGK